MNGQHCASVVMRAATAGLLRSGECRRDAAGAGAAAGHTPSGSHARVGVSATRRVLCTHPAACGLIDVVYGGGGNVSSGLVPGVSNSVMTVAVLPQLLVCERRVVVGCTPTAPHQSRPVDISYLPVVLVCSGLDFFSAAPCCVTAQLSSSPCGTPAAVDVPSLQSPVHGAHHWYVIDW